MTDADMRVVRPIVSLKKQVVDNLRAMITGGRFKPGDRLIERELCEMLDVSRTLIREALSHLVVEGIVQLIPHRGPVVSTYTANEAKSIYELRASLEEMAGELFTLRASDTERSELQNAFDDLKRVYRSKIDSDRMVAKARFYRILAQGSHNPILLEMLGLLHGRVTMLRAATLSQPGRLEKSLAELNEIVRGIEKRDAKAAGRACRRHVENACAIATTILMEAEQNGLDASGKSRHSMATRQQNIGKRRKVS